MLGPFLGALLGGRPIVIVSNREPWIHRRAEDGGPPRVERPASGLVSALEPLAEASGGTWIAHGIGSADRLVVDGQDAVALPPGRPRYRLRRLWLSAEQVRGYSTHLANRGLWPLCHLAFVEPEFDPDHWRTYRQVNELFARAVLEETPAQGAMVFLQDFHLALVPSLLKRARPSLTVAQFWHVPWPPAEQLRACPYSGELIEGLLGNDLLGFQTGEHCRHFLEAVERFAPADAMPRPRGAGGASPEPEVLVPSLPAGHVTRIGSFPISIDFDAWSGPAGQPEALEAMALWRRQLGLEDCPLGIGIDRLDYTKGLAQRLRAVDLLLERHPDWRGRLRFLQLVAPARDGIALYGSLRRDLEQLVARINRRWRQGSWYPLLFLQERRGPLELLALHRLAAFCLVSSLDDGMNLVAKEFVASRCDGDGVLILSRHAGSARELEGALLVNPFAVEELAEAMHGALTMEEPLRRARMARMRSQVREHNVYHWAATLLGEAAQAVRHAGPQALSLAGGEG